METRQNHSRNHRTASSEPAEVRGYEVGPGLLSGSISIPFLFFFLFFLVPLRSQNRNPPPLYIPLPAEGYQPLKHPAHKRSRARLTFTPGCIQSPVAAANTRTDNTNTHFIQNPWSFPPETETCRLLSPPCAWFKSAFMWDVC